MKIAPIYDPKKRRRGPKPAKVDLHRVFVIGLVIWCAITVIVVVLFFAFHIHVITMSLYTCLFGILIGIGLLVWEKINRDHYMNLALGTSDDTATYATVHAVADTPVVTAPASAGVKGTVVSDSPCPKPLNTTIRSGEQR
ncbi:MAG: hypothetical protein U0K19_03805 [Bifidobacteriaceae bacterium]|nr:hypothetical protein [Aeriscardovia sp.]MEE1324705.1 hypothetical protein [Bifidobacteriaceae bacterium]